MSKITARPDVILTEAQELTNIIQKFKINAFWKEIVQLEVLNVKSFYHLLPILWLRDIAL